MWVTKPLYQHIAALVKGIEDSGKIVSDDLNQRIKESIDSLVRSRMPHGVGFQKVVLDYIASKSNELAFEVIFCPENESVELNFRVWCRPDLVNVIALSVSWRNEESSNREDVHQYIIEMFEVCLLNQVWEHVTP